MKCFLPSQLLLSLLLSIGSASLYAGAPVPAPDSPEQGEVEPASEFSMADISLMKMRGGNYWTGFFVYTIDLAKAEMHANWNRMDCSMKKAEGDAKISSDDLLKIKSAVEALQYEPIAEDEPCFLMADGDESSLRLLHSADDKDALSYYPMKSWYSRCEGKPLSNESYQTIEKIVFGILPQPIVKEAWSEVDPKFACTSEVTVSR
ncbi:MAG: hypothetical protein EOP07_11490 [Proteobacteria bacterium]|nr:MAG: hypothetical protein EOP07_11490 [Pseudomonadota bacterium]